MASVVKRNPEIHWRVERHREDHAREVLGDPGRTPEDIEIDEMGTVTLLFGGVMHQLNFVGGEIWKLCDGKMDRGQIADALLDQFETEPDALRQDVDSFIDEMILKGMLNEG